MPVNISNLNLTEFLIADNYSTQGVGDLGTSVRWNFFEIIMYS